MTRSPFDDTLEQITRLGQQSPAPTQDALHGAAAFVEGVRDALGDAGGTWQTPIVEAGGGGAVVLLWQDNQRMLSLVAEPEGGTRWFYDPGAPLGYLNMADASQLLTAGASSPADFARIVWPAWARGDAPSPA